MSRPGRVSRSAALLAVLLAGPAVVLSCATSAAPAAPASAPPGPPRQLVPPPAPPLPPPVPVSSFTGLPTDPAAPMLGVKIDNVPQARPQSGLEMADLVYVEPVEGGLSRLLVVFQSQLPPVVGPIRSIRHSDLELLAGFGRPALAFSGEAPALRPLIEQAPVLDVSVRNRPTAYHRDGHRPAPHDLYGDPHQLREGAAPPRDIGFRFGPPPPGGEPVADTVVRYMATEIGLQWVPAEARWLITMDGAPLVAASGARPGAATVVLQRVALHDTGIRDAAGAPSPLAVTVGTGDAVVLRDGLAFAGHWSRPTPDQGTTFALPDGVPLLFAPGPVWVILVPA